MGEYHREVTGLVAATGTEVCTPSPDGHGKVHADGLHFRHIDGKLFTPFGTAVYALAHQPDELVEKTLESTAPLTRCACAFSPSLSGTTATSLPSRCLKKGEWQLGCEKPCPAFWHRIEDILQRLFQLDIQLDLILFPPMTTRALLPCPRRRISFIWIPSFTVWRPSPISDGAWLTSMTSAPIRPWKTGRKSKNSWQITTPSTVCFPTTTATCPGMFTGPTSPTAPCSLRA